jgi:hypothetical protein
LPVAVGDIFSKDLSLLVAVAFLCSSLAIVVLLTLLCYMAAASSSSSSAVQTSAQTHENATALVRSTGQPVSEHDLFGSRARVLKAAHICCKRQGLLTLADSNQVYFMLCEIHQFAQNDISLLMQINLNETNYGEFLQLVWGRKISRSLNL